jgi:hypothetical protein
MVQIPKTSQTLLMTSGLLVILVTSSVASTTVFIRNTVYAQNSNTGFGETTYLALTNGKTIPLKYVISTGKLLGVVLEKSRATLTVILSSPSTGNGNLTIQVPRDVVDSKKEGNADAQFKVHVDGKDATFTEISNTKTTRILSIQFNQNAKVIDIIGSQSTVQ